MKAQQVVLTTSVIAAVDLVARRFVGLDGNLPADGAKVLGTVEADTAAGNVAPTNVLGIMVVEAAAAVAAGAEVQTNAEGRAVPKAAGASNGIALDVAAGAGDLIRIVRGI